MAYYNILHVAAEPLSVPVASATVVEIGDMVALVSNLVVPAVLFTWTTNEATTQENFHDVFLGVALSRSKAGETDPVLVSPITTLEYDCAAATFNFANLVGPPKNSGANTLESQMLASVGAVNLSVGRTVTRYASNTTIVQARIVSSLFGGGVQTPE